MSTLSLHDALPILTGSGLSVLLIDRLAEVLTVVGAVAVLGVLGSAVAELAVAVLDRSAVWDGLTVPCSVRRPSLGTPRLARVQVAGVVPEWSGRVPVADQRGLLVV